MLILYLNGVKGPHHSDSFSGDLPEEGDGMDVTAAYSRYPPCHEVPDSYAAIVTTHSQLCPPPVEGAGEGLTARVQDAFIMLRSVVGV